MVSFRCGKKFQAAPTDQNLDTSKGLFLKFLKRTFILFIWRPLLQAEMAEVKAITVTQKPWLTLGHASTVLYTKPKINHSYLVWLNVSQRVFHCQQQTQILKKKKKIKATSQVLLKPRQALLNFLQYSGITCDHCKLSNFETGTTYNEQQFFLKPFLMVIITLSCHQIAIYVYRLSQSLFVYKCSTDRELFLSLSTAKL